MSHGPVSWCELCVGSVGSLGRRKSPVEFAFFRSALLTAAVSSLNLVNFWVIDATHASFYRIFAIYWKFGLCKSSNMCSSTTHLHWPECQLYVSIAWNDVYADLEQTEMLFIKAFIKMQPVQTDIYIYRTEHHPSTLITYPVNLPSFYECWKGRRCSFWSKFCFSCL